MMPVASRNQLLANPDFREGMRGWRTERGEVELVESAGERLLLLRGSADRPAWVVGEPVAVAPGATYRVGVRASNTAPGLHLRVIWVSSSGHELSHEAWEAEGRDLGWEAAAPEEAAFASVALAATDGEHLVRGASLTPVGPRMRIASLTVSEPVLRVGHGATLVCELANDGSEPIPRPEVALHKGCELLPQGVEPVHTLGVLPPGGRMRASWPVNAMEAGAYGVQARASGQGVSTVRGAVVVAAEEPMSVPATSTGVVSRRWYAAVSTRTFRIVLPELDCGVGIGTVEAGDPYRFCGWVRLPGLVEHAPDEPALALLAARRKVDGAILRLHGSSRDATWEHALYPSVERRALTVETRYVARRAHRVGRIEGFTVCLLAAENTDGCGADRTECDVAFRRGGKVFVASVECGSTRSDVLHAGWSDDPAKALFSVLRPRLPLLAAGHDLFWQQVFRIGPAGE